MKKMSVIIILLTLVGLAAPALAGGPGYCYDPATRAGYVCPPCNCKGDEVAEKKAGKCATCGMALVAKKDLTHVAILLRDGVELLDFSGPAEVFSRAGFLVYTVTQDGKSITSQGFLSVKPDYSMENCPWPDVLVIPGGGTGGGDELNTHWIKTVAQAQTTGIVMSVCSGAFVLARLGLLDGIQATTHAADIEELRRAAPRTRVHADTRYVDNGRVITTAGVSSGIDGALRVVQRLRGDEAARKTAGFIAWQGWPAADAIVVSKAR